MAKTPIIRRQKRTNQEFSRIAKNLSTQIATRTNLNPWIAVYDALPNPDPVLRKTSNRIEILHEIKREPHVSACSKSRKAGVTKRKWKIEEGNAASSEVEIIESIFENLRIRKVIREILDAWGYGYKPLEILWQREGNLIIPESIVGVPPEYFEFGIDNELRLKQENSFKSEPVEPHKFLLAQYEASYSNPYGEAQYSLAFWPTTFKKGGIKFWAQFMESFGMPHAVGKVPRSQMGGKEASELLNALTLLIQNAAAVFPDDASVELLETKAGSGSSDLYERHARYHDGEISKCILGHGSAADATPGKLGGDDPAMDVRSDIIADDSSMVMECFDELIRSIYALNPTWGAERPGFVLYDEEDVDTARADRDFKLMNSGRIILKKSYFTKRYDFDESDIEVIEKVDPLSPSTPTNPVNAEFSSATPGTAGQENVDDLLTGITDAIMQQQVERFLKPVIELVELSSSYEEVQAGILKLYPKLNTSEITNTLERAMLLSSLQGEQPGEIRE
ncbi:MAG: DUF935 family protein [Candidatus Paceibacterota bacterium]|jgi:phage gp29-like protein